MKEHTFCVRLNFCYVLVINKFMMIFIKFTVLPRFQIVTFTILIRLRRGFYNFLSIAINKITQSDKLCYDIHFEQNSDMDINVSLASNV